MRPLVSDSIGQNECLFALTSDNPPMVVNSKQIVWMLKRRESRLRVLPSPCKMPGRSLHAIRRHQTENSGFTKKTRK